jgi:peptide/nickel transport system permease protein
MTDYIVRRVFWAIVVLIGVSLFTFLLIFLGPVDPAQALVGDRAGEETINAVRQEYGLDQPIYVQYARYVSHLVQGDLGDSLYFQIPVKEAIFGAFPATAELALSIMVVALLIGIPMGVITALRANSALDRGLTVFGLLTISVPSFLFGLLLIYFLAFKLALFPIGGFGDGSLSHLALPTLTVALPWGAWYAIILRTNMLDVMSADFTRTAYAKGLRERAVAFRHTLRNAILPLITMVGMDLATLLNGIVLVEQVFNWPGIGWQALTAARNFDVPMILGSVLFGAALLATANLVVDVLYTFLDPRVRLT